MAHEFTDPPSLKLWTASVYNFSGCYKNHILP